MCDVLAVALIGVFYWKMDLGPQGLHAESSGRVLYSDYGVHIQVCAFVRFPLSSLLPSLRPFSLPLAF